MVRWLNDARDGLRIMLEDKALNLPALFVLVFALGSVLTWIAIRDGDRAHRKDSLER